MKDYIIRVFSSLGLYAGGWRWVDHWGCWEKSSQYSSISVRRARWMQEMSGCVNSRRFAWNAPGSLRIVGFHGVEQLDGSAGITIKIKRAEKREADASIDFEKEFSTNFGSVAINQSLSSDAETQNPKGEKTT